MGYLFLFLEEEGLTNTCCLSWLFKRAGFLLGKTAVSDKLTLLQSSFQISSVTANLQVEGLEMTHSN